ncbi:MAG: hypothetical protein A3A80_03085 [Candidatus Terrybacteria bacterium RIFCSPLOWO2_01_FULL_44_24]|uniref:Putative pre-16S rRNA nuclease n=1 Tax=Candidatus Terrybacteria bacterium RIFCSPHIGHO2_01_FULL_43_35 TaxID=1802361 RepID=A0A1G2PCX9_9BACT|nr:MAG: hypothetical protein A2828_03240 [Candidatus Terrybacteria bacterium RIFCSPHIGHO2_01_FULL_43_35]OHA49414.1 MAG: hypothetical protein A3B75_02870 [Candidatus Terrybacteria bacterium RIFCSPHIGHO2_02_FULL_43_14]OHA51639.1 MAG: hypothetical protein A3A80_03085 [Candidatus Terrybacteria bacterium RIFCSPLOWO2_01_FULL_44_24]
MRILAIDYGEKRIGLAMGDSANKIAFPRGILQNSPRIFEEIKDFCRKESIDKIVVGLPLSLSGQDSAQTKATRSFIESLGQNINIPIVELDERLTSVEARKIVHGDKKPRTRASTVRGRDIDDIAASLLLGQYFQVKK